MGRKRVADMTPEEREANREYMRKAKARSRLGKPPEKDKRKKRDRAAYQRAYRARKKKEAENKNNPE